MDKKNLKKTDIIFFVTDNIISGYADQIGGPFETKEEALEKAKEIMNDRDCYSHVFVCQSIMLVEDEPKPLNVVDLLGNK